MICRLLWDCAGRLEDVFNMFWENIKFVSNYATAHVPAGKTKAGDFVLSPETAKALKEFC